MKLFIIISLLVSSFAYAQEDQDLSIIKFEQEEEAAVISIREPIPFNVDYVEKIEKQLVKESKKVAKDVNSTLKFKTSDISAHVFNPRIPFRDMKLEVDPSLSPPIIPKILKD